MSKVRIFTENTLQEGESCLLGRHPSHHVLKVLRMQVLEQVFVFNGDGNEYLGVISSVSSGCVLLDILSSEKKSCESCCRVHLAQALVRGQKMDYVIQKAVECGVFSITPLITERCGVKLSGDRLAKKIRHWQQVAISACEQSGRCCIPEVHAPQLLGDYLKQRKGMVLMAHVGCENSLPQECQDLEDIDLLVGPEGGFSEQEVNLAQRNACCFMSLGPRVLRTDTAPVVAITLLQNRFGDIKF